MKELTKEDIMEIVERLETKDNSKKEWIILAAGTEASRVFVRLREEFGLKIRL